MPRKESVPREEQRDGLRWYKVAVLILIAFGIAYVLGTMYFLGEDWTFVL